MLLDEPATITRNRVLPKVHWHLPFEILTRPTAPQEKPFKLLGVKPECTR